MAISKGISNLIKLKEEAASRREAMNSPKAEWFSPKGRPNGAKIKFLQDLDDVFMVTEHQAPGKDGWKAKAECSYVEEGACYACEMNRKEPGKGWKQKEMLYMNIMDEDGVVKILSRSIHNSFVEWLLEFYNETGTIKADGRGFKIKQTGEGFQTAWTALEIGYDLDTSGAQLYDLEKTVVRKIPYADQEEYYNRVAAPASKEEKENNTDLEW